MPLSVVDVRILEIGLGRRGVGQKIARKNIINTR